MVLIMNSEIKVIGDIYCAGVYGFKKVSDGEFVYIGSSLEINDAKSRHLYYLRRGLYANTNKSILQNEYDKSNLILEVIKESCHDKGDYISAEQKDNLHKALSVLEKFYIDLYKTQICNSQKDVTKHSSNKDINTSVKRREKNNGNKNPNCKTNIKIINAIKTDLKNGMKVKKVAEKYEKSKGYISAINTGRRWSSVNIDENRSLI